MTENLMMIVLMGILGGVGREFLRWKLLAKRGRAGSFIKPLFLALVIVELMLCGVVAAVLSPLAGGTKYLYPLAIVCGAGFEELVRRASNLDVWIPSVLPAKAIEDPSLCLFEFLRA